MKDKVALITGGTSGIGRETAVLFSRQGAKVAFTGRREEQGNQTVALINDLGGEALFIKADASKEDDCRRMVEETVAKFGRIDYAFNNAGIEGNMVPVVEQTEENFHRVMNINVWGVLCSMKYEIPAMIKSGGGAIVNNASVASLIGMPGISVYGASKHAVAGLTKTAALEVAASGIRVNAVSPGAIQTDMLNRFSGGTSEGVDAMAKMHPLGRVGKAMEIASSVLFLCSEGAGFITGTNLVIDGGLTVP